jgi:uncharacterized membrane protein
MEKPFYVIMLIIILIVIIVSVILILPKVRESSNTKTIELNQACLELIKQACDNQNIVINSKSFEDICKENGLKLDECKSYCGC